MMNRNQIMKKLRANHSLLRQYSVRSISVFGSVARGENRPESDVDLLVEFDPEARIGLFTFAYLKDLLSEPLGCPVDLVTPDALHPALKESILEEAVHVA